MPLIPEAGRKTRKALLTQFADHPDPLLDRQVIRLDRVGETQVGKGVFMGTIKEGVVGQGREPLQGVVHLGGGAFEQTTAAGGEEGITTKQHAIAVVGDVAKGMTGHMNHIQPQAMPVDPVPVLEPLAVMGRHGIVPRAVEAGMGEVAEQLADPADMIMMMMGQQDGIEFEPQDLEPLQHRGRLTGIDNQAVIVVADQPDVVVVKGGNCDDGIHGSASLCVLFREGILYNKMAFEPRVGPIMQLARTEQQIEIPTSWSALPMGDWVAAELQERLDNWCPHLFGYHLLKIGALSAELSCGNSSIRHQIGIAPGGRLLDLKGDPLALPVRTGSVDACLLAHCLDFSPDPHQVLREAERVLTEDGWLIVSGYNPTSLVGLGHYLPFMRHQLPWSARMFTPTRVTDWLQLLGCEVMFDERFGFSFMGKQSRIGWWRESLGRDYCRPLASVYVIAARKRRFPITPVRRRWRLPESMAAPGMARQGW
jgi:SAM-dependent methyltransferase